MGVDEEKRRSGAAATARAASTTAAPVCVRAPWVICDPVLPDVASRPLEAALETTYGATQRGIDHQVWFSTQKIPRRGRFADVFVDGIAHESKVGLVGFSKVIQKQIEKDALLIKNQAITGAHWHFFASATSSSIGADPRVIDLLLEKGIPFTIHVP